MKKTILAVLAVSAGLGLALTQPASAEKGKGPCAEDTAKFCKDIKPGEGRIAACLKEHQKEISQACSERKTVSQEKRGKDKAGTCLGAYDKGFSSGFKYGLNMRTGLKAEGGRKNAKASKACVSDREKFCAGVKPGEGRLRDCLQKNIKDLSAGCKARQEKVKEKLEKKGNKV
ncbi:MAG: hypothetical protein COX65_10100 [Elusimicrobia bacterium CG_4_10_14_0_2_um_filter_56_8]|nr:MAG: hypothetical protein AUJ51_13375 [Elusimicrobia bacterium CG1_02_56_21]PJA11639.1 MAG: hypothetical protein COX65_10100 [Elusimicrobia bacterium CG_4_10_14_0_2_um_filter_56_8]